MTLSTRIAIADPVSVESLYRVCNALLTDDDRTETKRESDMIMNHPDQGLAAWLTVRWGEPLYSANGWEGEKYPLPWPVLIEIDFDTIYGYRGPQGGTCSDLHAFYITKVGDYLDIVGARWRWRDEFTGLWHDIDALSYFGDADKGRVDPATRV